MKRGVSIMIFFYIAILWLCGIPLTARAEIASDNAFDGAVWEKIIEDDLEAPQGVVQSICATEEYIICMENYGDGSSEPDIIKAYYRNNTDKKGKPVKQYSLAKRVADTNYEHANGMAYNPNTKEIAVALYSNYDGENRGCLFLMDAETLKYKGKVKVSDDYNILGIDYDEENDRYIIQTDVDGGYSFKILDSRFQVIEDLGEYAGTAKGDNFQDLCVSGDYIINFPLTLNLEIGNYINMYSISRRGLVSDAPLDFGLQDTIQDEPEGICELEPGVFAAAVTVDHADGARTVCVYKTMVPYNFTAAEQQDPEKEAQAKEEDKPSSGEDAQALENVGAEPEVPAQGQEENNGEQKKAFGLSGRKLTMKGALIIVSVMFIVADIILLFYLRWMRVRRERQRRLEETRRERRRIQRIYD